MGRQRVLEKGIQVHGKILRLFKDCPKPNGWFGGIVNDKNLGEMRFAGICDVPVSVGVVIDAVADLVEVQGYDGGSFEQLWSPSVTMSMNDNGTLISYFCGSVFPGIGRVKASKIVSEFGKDAVNMIASNPDEVQRRCKLSVTQMEVLKKGISSNYSMHRLITKYPHLGASYANRLVREIQGSDFMGVKRVVAIVSHTFEDVDKRIQINPYSLVDDGVPFPMVDEVAQKDCHLAWDDARRVDCIFFRAFQSFMNGSGSTYLNLSDVSEMDSLRRDMAKVLRGNEYDPSVTPGFISRMITRLSKDGRVFVDGGMKSELHVYPTMMKRIEQDIVDECVHHLAGGSYCSKFDSMSDKYLGRVKAFLKREKRSGNLVLCSEQEDAIHKIVKNSLCCLTGGPGRGKTHVMKALAQAWSYATKGRVVMLAPTGKAVNRMKESTDWKEAQTVARCLYFNSRDFLDSDTREKMKTDICDCNGEPCIPKSPKTLLIVDEASMIDFVEGARILRLFHDCHIAFVGDSSQLSPIEPGAFFHELVTSGVVPVAKLVVNHRTSSLEISDNADRIIAGDPKLEITSNFSLVPNGDEAAVDYVVDMYKQYLLNGADFSDILLMSPVNTGVGSVMDINKRLQNDLNSESPNNPTKHFDSARQDYYAEEKGWVIPHAKCRDLPFRLCDRVMNTKNHADAKWHKFKYDNPDEVSVDSGYGYFNGDTGTVLRYYYGDDEHGPYLLVLLDDGRMVTVDIELFHEWSFGYCVTIHKSQGSEAKKCMVVFSSRLDGRWFLEHDFLSRNLLYTAVTRAKEEVSIVGNMNAFRRCVATPYEYHNTALADYLGRAGIQYFVRQSLSERRD